MTPPRGNPCPTVFPDIHPEMRESVCGGRAQVLYYRLSKADDNVARPPIRRHDAADAVDENR